MTRLAPLALSITMAVTGGTVLAATNTQPAQAVVMSVSHMGFSDRPTMRVQDATHYWDIPKGYKYTKILKNPPRKVRIPEGYEFTWNPWGPGLYWWGKKDDARWVEVPWAVQVGFEK